MRRPRAALALMMVHGPLQIDATGLPASKKLFTNATALGCIRKAPGLMTPPGSSNASTWRSIMRTKSRQIVQYELTLYALREGAEWLADQQYEASCAYIRRT